MSTVKMEGKSPASQPARCSRIGRGFKNFFTLVPGGATPVNYSILFTVVFALAFGYKEEDKGYYAGFIAASMFAGRVGGSFFWGWMSDRYGRRPIMLITTLAVGIFNLAFGFSQNVYWACVTRFLNGIFNGLVGTVKTVLYEISDDTNQAAGMSGIAMAWGGGVVIGPLISGFLASPAKKYPDVFPVGSLFHTFPFLLPSLVAFLWSVAGFIVVWFKLPETLPSKVAAKNDKKDPQEAVAEALLQVPAESRDLPIANQSEDAPQIILSKAKSTNHIDLAVTTAFTSQVERKYSLSKSMSHLYVSAKYQDAYDIYGLCQPAALSQQLLNQTSPTSVVKSSESLNAFTVCNKDISRSVNDINTCDSVSWAQSYNGHCNGVTNPDSIHINGVKLTVNESPNGHVGVDMKETRVVQVSADEDPVIKIESPIEKDDPGKMCCFRLKEMTVCRLLRMRDVLISILLYTVISFNVIGFEELFIIWASTEKRLGGLALSASKIGAAVGGSSSGLLLIQVFLYPKLVSKFGPLRVLQVAGVYLIVFSALVPCLRHLDSNSVILWLLLIIPMGVQKLAMTSAFSSISIFINNSVTPSDAGSVNGLAMTFSALARTLAPLVAGSMYAWSITSGVNIGFPFDVNMAFIFCAVLFLLGNVLTAFTPRSLEKQKKHEN